MVLWIETQCTNSSGVIIEITLEREAYDHCSHCPATHQVAEAVAHSHVALHGDNVAESGKGFHPRW